MQAHAWLLTQLDAWWPLSARVGAGGVGSAPSTLIAMSIYICIFSITRPLTDESLPCARVLTLPPAIGPAHHHRVVLHAPKATGLDEMDNALPHLGRHHHLAEALDSLNLHHILYGLKEIWKKYRC